MDAGFYRGTNADQDTRFSDKEKKLLKQMKFESALDQKVDLSKINLEVVKPWITLRLNDILGMEDDVVVEYVFTQLEQKDLNPKVMQINLTGFLNARRAREFVGELWQLFVEAQNSPDGIPTSLIEKKMQELKAASSSKFSEPTLSKVISADWKHRYQSLTGGRYGKTQPNYNSEPQQFDPDDKSERIPSPRRRRHDDRNDHRTDRYDRDRDRTRGRRGYDRDADRRNDDRDRHRRNDDHYPARKVSRSRTPPRSPRRHREELKKEADRKENEHNASTDDESDREEPKKKKKKSRHRSDSESDHERKRAKKHKKEKKEKKAKKKSEKRERDDD
jgi:serine/arginine repetitive matrix protein 1